MSRLIIRHPIRAAREPFGKAGLIVAIVALVAAIGGTALAASGLNSKQKKEVDKDRQEVRRGGSRRCPGTRWSGWSRRPGRRQG